ncbi:hypothetical protein QF026_002680 [Streptomyces aurantiacus]|nr:hypothetical protein [Streptomyces aurantiacus]
MTSVSIARRLKRCGERRAFLSECSFGLLWTLADVKEEQADENLRRKSPRGGATTLTPLTSRRDIIVLMSRRDVKCPCRRLSHQRQIAHDVHHGGGATPEPQANARRCSSREAVSVSKQDPVRPRLCRRRNSRMWWRKWPLVYPPPLPRSECATQPGWRRPRPAAVFKRVDDELGAVVAGHRVADDLAGGQVQSTGEVEPAFAGGQGGEVAHQLRAGGLGVEVAADQVGSRLPPGADAAAVTCRSNHPSAWKQLSSWPVLPRHRTPRRS